MRTLIVVNGLISIETKNTLSSSLIVTRSTGVNKCDQDNLHTYIPGDNQDSECTEILLKSLDFLEEKLQNKEDVVLNDVFDSFHSVVLILEYLQLKSHKLIVHSSDDSTPLEQVLQLLSRSSSQIDSTDGIRHLNEQFPLVTSTLIDHLHTNHNVEKEKADAVASFLEQYPKFHKAVPVTHLKRNSQADINGLVFWPPVQRQSFTPSKAALVWKAGQKQLSIFVNSADCVAVLQSSGVLNSFAELGFSFRIVCSPTSADVCLYLDAESCSERHGYDIQVDGQQAVVVAGDKLGLTYALYTFQQLVTLHSASISSDERSSERNYSIPAVVISDSPDVARRVVVWSVDRLLKMSSEQLAETMVLLSRLRYSEVHVKLDLSVHEADQTDLSVVLTHLADLCRELAIRVLPVISPDQLLIWNSFHMDFLKPISTDGAIALSLTGGKTSLLLNTVDLEQSYTQFLDIAMSAGFTTLLLSSSDWLQAGFDPLTITAPEGLTVQQSAASFFNVSSSSVFCVQELVHKTATYTTKAVNGGSTHFVDFSEQSSDFTQPVYLQQLAYFLFSGLSWNNRAVLTYLEISHTSSASSEPNSPGVHLSVAPASGRISYDLSVLRHVIKHFLLPSTASPATSSAVDSVVSVLTGELIHLELQTIAANQSSTMGLESTISSSDFARAESTLWYVLSKSSGEQEISSLPTRKEIIVCSQVYQKILTATNWKGWKAKKPEDKKVLKMAEELFYVMNLLSALCRAVILSYNTRVSSIHKNIGQQKRAAVYDNVDTSGPYTPKIYPKSDEIRQLLSYVVQQNILFRNYKTEEHVSIVEAFECVQIKAGEIVIKQGDSGECFYIIESGHVDVYMECSNLKIKIGQTLSRGNYFGELALMYNTPRAATVVSSEDCVLWRIDRQTYRTIVTYHNRVTCAEFIKLISNVHILGKCLGDVLSNNELNKVVSSLELEEFEDQSVIIRQHLTGDYFYIITEGKVDVWQEVTPGGVMMGKKVAHLSRGDYFGEKALLADDVRQASCVAVGKVVCLSLSREDFIAMLGSWQDLTGNKHLNAASPVQREGQDTSSSYQMSIALNDLQILSTLGVGAFGKVKLAKHKVTQQTFAVKYQSKAFITTQNMQSMVISEARIMKDINHPCIAKLYSALQDTKFVYFVLELLPGGEFFSYLQLAGKLSEEKSRFYSAAVVCAFEELHKNKIAYRDLKPENMVLDSRGYVKLVDLGLAKQILSGSTWTMCGTPDYLAPELVLNKGHDIAVDYWALGVLVYEMINGWPPFFHDNPMKVYEKIISGKVDFPETFSKSLEDFISKLLTKNPSKRLGNMKGGIVDITKHRWFGSFDWKGLINGTIVPHYVPDLTEFNKRALPSLDENGEEEEDDEDEDDDDFEESDWIAEF